MGFSVVQQHLFSFLNLKKVAYRKSVLEIIDESSNSGGLDESLLSEKLSEEIKQINKIIQKYNLEIVEYTDEVTCEKLIILINTGDNTAQKSLFYNENTTHYFSKIVNECVLSEEGSLSETNCLNLNTQAKISKSDAQSILQNLIKDKWLDCRNGKISLAMRSLAELEQSIKQHYPNDIKNCLFCKLIVLQGYICHKCKNKCHFACCKKYFKLSKQNCVCPSCKELWNDIPSVIKIEDSFQETDTSFGDSSVQHPRKKKK